MPNDTSAMMHTNGLPFEETVSHLRQGIKAYAALVKDCFKDHPHWKDETNGIEDPAEMKANLMLCYRHLEDAAMRLERSYKRRTAGSRSTTNKTNRPKFSENQSGQQLTSVHTRNTHVAC